MLVSQLIDDLRALLAMAGDRDVAIEVDGRFAWVSSVSAATDGNTPGVVATPYILIE